MCCRADAVAAGRARRQKRRSRCGASTGPVLVMQMVNRREAHATLLSWSIRSSQTRMPVRTEPSQGNHSNY
jgi:hypothetical protein